MFVATGAGGAVFADAGFMDFGQRAFEGGPEGGDLMLPLFLYLRVIFHGMYVYHNTYIHGKTKTPPQNPASQSSSTPPRPQKTQTAQSPPSPVAAHPLFDRPTARP